MAFVINPVENRSTQREVIVAAWVFEGVVKVGDFARHAALLKTTSFGIDPTTEELASKTELLERFCVEVEILRIIKTKEHRSMPAGYSANFYFYRGGDSKRIAELLTSHEYRWIRPAVKVSRDFPQVLKKIFCLIARARRSSTLKKRC